MLMAPSLFVAKLIFGMVMYLKLVNITVEVIRISARATSNVASPPQTFSENSMNDERIPAADGMGIPVK